MKLGIRFADKIVGVFIILAIGILIFVIFMLGSSQRWFSRDYFFRTYFDSGAGLSQNMAVQYKGFTIGHVKSIELVKTGNDDRVEVGFTIFDTYIDRVRQGSLVEVQVSPVGLGNTFLFHPGLGKDLIDEGEIIPTVNSDEGKRLVAAGLVHLPEGGDSIGQLIATLNTLLSDIQEALAGSDRTELGQIIGGVNSLIEGLQPLPDDIDGILNMINAQVDSILDDVKKLINKLSDPDGTVMAILDSDREVYTGLVSLIDSVSGILRSLDKTVEHIPPLMPEIGTLLTEVHVVLQSVQDLLVSLANNPLLKGGVPERKETPAGGTRPRDIEF